MYHSGGGFVCKFGHWALLTGLISQQDQFSSLTSFINLNEFFILIGFNSSVDVGERGGDKFFLSSCVWKP